MNVFVTGANGFIGAHLVRTLTAAGHRVTGLCRKGSSPADAPPGAERVEGDVTDRATLSPGWFAGCDAIFHLVGIIAETRSTGQTFETVHVGGTRNLLGAALEGRFGGHFVYLSALGADLDALSRYSQTKAQAEQEVLGSGLPFTTFRPSIVLGPEAAFLRQIEELVRRPPGAPFPIPFVPIPGDGATRFQPVWIDELTNCMAACVGRGETAGRTFDVAGATVVTFDQIVEAVQRHVGIKKPLLHVPSPVMFGIASVLESLLPRPPVTTDQLVNLRRDNVGDVEPLRQAFGVEPLAFEPALARCYVAARAPR